MCSKSPSNNSSELSFFVCFLVVQRHNELKSGDYKQNALTSGDNKQNEHKSGDNKQTELKCGDYKPNELKSGDYKQNEHKSGDNKQNELKCGDYMPNELKCGDYKRNELKCGDYKREARCTRSCQPRAEQGKASKARGELSLDLLKNCPVVFLRISSLEFFPLDKTFNRTLEAKPAIKNAMTKKSSNSLYMVSFSMTVNNKAFQKQCKSIKLP